MIDATPAATHNRTSRLLQNIAALGVSQGFTWASSAVLIAFLPRHLSGSELGQLAAVSVFVMLLGYMTDFGVTSYLVKMTPQLDDKTAAQMAVNTLALMMMLACVAIGAGVLVAHFLLEGHQAKLILYVSLPGIALQTIYSWLVAWFRGLQDMKPMAVADAIGKPVYVAVVVALLLADFGPVEVAAASILPCVVGLAVVAPVLAKRPRLTTKIEPSLWRPLLTGGSPFFVWQASLVIYGQIDFLFLAKLTTDSVVGWYSVAYKLISIPVFLPTIVVGALFPALSQAAKHDPGRVKPLVWNSCRAVFFLTLPMALGTAVLPDQIIGFLGYASEFKHAVPLVSILALHMPIVGITMIIGTCLFVIEKQWGWVRFAIMAAFLNPALNLILIPATDHAFGNGAIGAAVATCCTEMFMLLGGLRLLPFSLFDRENVSGILRILLAGLIMVPVVWWLRDAGPLLIPVVAGAVVYFAAALSLGAIPRDEILAVVRQRLRRAAESEAKPKPAGVTVEP
jgi:PST family polysaccharide transporter